MVDGDSSASERIKAAMEAAGRLKALIANFGKVDNLNDEQRDVLEVCRALELSVYSPEYFRRSVIAYLEDTRRH
jgi:hypothetical protein